MKLKNAILPLSLILFLFQACIPSLHPLYTKDKLVMKKELPGSWVGDETQKMQASTWDFKTNKDKSYSLIYSDEDGKPASFHAHLIRLEDHYFLNFFPRSPSEEEQKKHPGLKGLDFNDFERIHYHSVNTFAKVTFKKDQVTIAPFDGDFVEKLLEQNRIRIKHEKVNGSFILTAQPAELQKFILKYADDPKAFPEPITLSRQ